ncbi:chromosome partition protein [Pseudomonas phage phiPsa267]|uniref:Chromosome partition protein n=2 Tax=Otagovirus TaxID=2560197 RepID=A0A7G9V0W3_9CAUD|nr:chromosome partition protein [Pseudomonas phage phiPsa381]YP_010767755.1 chromosome partition protein [Pseudomonas phage phiPsa267]QNN99918.1 chromosome partition protein [Pseudomonas phage phiPsa267]QNO00610.1 chromosome partition protein [Pseudomonas phage phiPsa381]
MKTILYIAQGVKLGHLDLLGAVTVEAERSEVNTYDAEGKYVDYMEVESERLDYDTNSFYLEPGEFTVEEIQAYMAGPFEEELRVYNLEKRAAVARIAELSKGVTGVMSEILELANKYNVPANITVNNSTNDFRLIDAVDWDSSSMYC